jgi:hypothetical protein
MPVQYEWIARAASIGGNAHVQLAVGLRLNNKILFH